MSYKGEKVLLLGAASPFGLLTSEYLVQNGAKVVGVVRSQNAAQKLTTQFPSITVIVQGKNEKEAAASLEKCLPFKKVISNLRGHEDWARKAIYEQSDEIIDLTTVFVRMHMTYIKIVFNDLVKRKMKGTLVRLSSTIAMRPLKGYGALSYVRGGIEMLNKCGALEGAPFGFRCNSILVGLSQEHLDASLRQENVLERMPISRVITKEDIFPTMDYLLSDSSAMVTGQCINVDGGVMLT